MKLLPLIVVMLMAVQVCASEANSAPAPLSNALLEISEHLTLAGTLDPAVVTTLPRDTILVDLKTLEEGTDVERAFVEGQGLRYENFPIGADGLKQEQLDNFAAVLQHNPNIPILLYCRSGNRAGLLYAAHLVASGMTADTAWNVVQPLVRPETQQAFRAYLQGN